MHKTGKLVRTCIAALGFVALLAACRDDDDDASTTTTESSTTTTESTTTSTSSTTTTTPPTPEEQAIAAYGGYWKAYYAAALVPDPNDPGLAEVMTGAQLTRTQDLIQQFVDQGLRGEAETLSSKPDAVEVQPTRVVLTDCYLSRDVLVRADTGEVVEPDDGESRSLRVTVVNEGGAWKVEDVLNEETPCTPG